MSSKKFEKKTNRVENFQNLAEFTPLGRNSSPKKVPKRIAPAKKNSDSKSSSNDLQLPLLVFLYDNYDRSPLELAPRFFQKISPCQGSPRISIRIQFSDL